MDSLTQIVLGAACGEVVLGKKVGNRAMLWGAVGGTIPDLDVIANFFLTDMQSLAFHRGISHSFFFAIVTPALFGWLVHRLYDSGWYQTRAHKRVAMLAVSAFLVLTAFIFNLAFKIIGGHWNIMAIILSMVLVGYGVFRLYKNYLTQPLPPVTATWQDWSWLFFWSIFTHPILDAFTAYGTQLFAPFSNYRVAFNTISVADPIYTVPFLACVVAATFFNKNRPLRRYLNYLGILLSCSYLLFTVVNKQRIDRVFEQSFTAQNEKILRFRTGPTIFNNILWNGVAETTDGYYYGMYSLFDKQPRVQQLFKSPKNHQLIEQYQDQKDVKIVQWFTDGYYTVFPLEKGDFMIGDLRYGTTKDRQAQPEDFVFKFRMEVNTDGSVTGHEMRDFEDRSDAFAELWKRIKGK